MTDTLIKQAFDKVSEQLDRIIVALGGSIGSPTTYAYYSDGSVVEYNIVGALNNNAIPKTRNGYNLTEVEIGTDVTSIGNSAFYGYSKLTSVTIPNGVTSIGSNAFTGCEGITSITIPEGVTSIEGATFYNCLNLTSVTIPNSVTSIGYGAFQNCYSLASLTIPNSVTSIGQIAFFNCSELTSITFVGKTMDQVQAMNNYSWYISDGIDIICSDGTFPAPSSGSSSG